MALIIQPIIGANFRELIKGVIFLCVTQGEEVKFTYNGINYSITPQWITEVVLDKIFVPTEEHVAGGKTIPPEETVTKKPEEAVTKKPEDQKPKKVLEVDSKTIEKLSEEERVAHINTTTPKYTPNPVVGEQSPNPDKYL